jgi:aryl-alcohol dehydrogenase-like predicted oxidoreductase
MSLPVRTLGRTNAEITILGYGAMELRGADYLGGPTVEERDAGRLLNAVLDEGITLIDTAIDYGHSEEVIGRHLASRRDEFFLASKAGCPIDLRPGVNPGPDTHDWSAANIRAGVEQSLIRLRTDRLDLVQVHLSPARSVMEAEGTVTELEALRTEGKLRFIGMSGTLPELPEQIAMGVFDEFQMPYSALQPDHDAVIAQAASAGAGVIIRGGTARGTGSEEKNLQTQPLSATGPSAADRWHAARLDEILPEGMSRHEFILRFTLSRPGVTAAIVGTANIEHLRSNITIASRGVLPADLLADARERLGLVATA